MKLAKQLIKLLPEEWGADCARGHCPGHTSGACRSGSIGRNGSWRGWFWQRGKLNRVEAAAAGRRVVRDICDIYMVLGYLRGKQVDTNGIGETLKTEIESGNSRNISIEGLSFTFYKKGTCHIVFEDLEALDMLNRKGAKNRNWLPPSYGMEAYEDMSEEEQRVVDDFEGEESYRAAYESGKLSIMAGDMGMKLIAAD